jgi:hypothetical protein
MEYVMAFRALRHRILLSGHPPSAKAPATLAACEPWELQAAMLSLGKLESALVRFIANSKKA